ncbi:MAG: PLP-dependent aminotransferase family protein [Clostridia bacterium]|nr:PLP-dependent aminotransferase family protein [Clostridia bacterium]
MKNQQPHYIQLYETLREEITRGVWPHGARMPSRRVLAKERGLSAVTVEHSYDLLCQEGYIEARPRSGFYVVFRPADGFARAPRRVEMPARGAFPQAPETAFPFAALARAVRRVLSEAGEALLLRSPSQGVKPLREALSGYLARNRGMQIRPEQIVIGSGAEYLYGLVVELLGRGRAYAIEAPSYEKIEQVYRARGVEVELLPLGRDGIQSDALAAARASVLHITPYRSFPSGVTADASKRREYLKWAEKPGRFIVEDDFESEFSLLRKPEETVFSNAKGQNVIYLNTFSRTVSPALRVGYMVLPKELMPEFTKKLGFYSCTVPTLEQYLLSDLIVSGEFERHINRIRRKKRREENESS